MELRTPGKAARENLVRPAQEPPAETLLHPAAGLSEQIPARLVRPVDAEEE